MSESSGPHPERLQRAQALFERGNDAALKSNFDYAIQMYLDACKFAPESLNFRQHLRGVERRKFGNDPAKVGRLVGVRLQPIRLRARTAKAKKDWKGLLEIAEEAFQHNPWDIGAARDQAEAAEHLGLKALARWSIESVFKQGEGDADFLRHAAHVFELNELWREAIHCWDKVREVDPRDDEARRKIQGLSASATISRAGLGDAIQRGSAGGSGPEVAAPPDAEELKRNAMTPEERLVKELEDGPDRSGPYLELADLYRRQNKLDEAEKVLARGRKAFPDDEVVRDIHSEVQLARLKRAIEAWGRRAKEHPDDLQAKAKLDQLVGMRNDYELRELRHRVERNPDDPALRLALGQCLARLGQHDAAIAEFQQVRASTALRSKALLHAAQSFEAKGLPKLAEKNYQEALKHADPDDQDFLNDLHYRLGRVAEAQGKLKDAEEHYNEVASNDYTYLDVAQRLQSLNERMSS